MKILNRNSLRSRCTCVVATALLLYGLLLPVHANRAQASEPTLNNIENSVTIYAYPPRHTIDWSSPKKALGTFIGNLIRIVFTKNNDVEFVSDFNESGQMSSRFKSSMGHTIGHIRCKLPSGEVYDRWSSLSGQDMTSVDKVILIKNKIGLGALFYNYLDGHIISGIENKMRITHYRGNKVDGEHIRPRYMQYEVDAHHCGEMKKMVEFFEGFHYPKNTTLADLERLPPEKVLYFTNMMDPYATYQQRISTGKGRVGGGCAPYGAALLKAAGRFRPEFDILWKTNVNISERLIGGLYDREKGEIRRVSLRQLLLTRLGSYWDYSEDGYANRRLSIYDPQLFWQFTGDVLSCVASSPYCGGRTGALVKSEKSLIKRGQPRIFRGPTEKGEPSEIVQRVDGFVWRLK